MRTHYIISHIFRRKANQSLFRDVNLEKRQESPLIYPKKQEYITYPEKTFSIAVTSCASKMKNPKEIMMLLIQLIF